MGQPLLAYGALGAAVASIIASIIAIGLPSWIVVA